MARSKRKKKGRKKKGSISVDFTGVESGGGRPVPDGNYTAVIHSISEEEGEESGQPYLAMRYKIAQGKHAGAMIFDNISLQPQSLWRFRTFLECIGYEVEEGPMDVDLADLLEEEIGIEVTNEEYDGKDKPRITGFMSPDEGEEEDESEGEEEEEEEESEESEEEGEEEESEEEEEEAPVRKKKGKKGKKLRVGSKVKFKDEEDDWIKGVIIELDEDDVTIEDSAGDSWEVDIAELKAA